jgi:sulfite exporter TauE/SafE
MRAILFLGFLMGARHAFDADHLAAVASLATRSRSRRAGVMQGVAWGFGHTLTLLVVGGLYLSLGAAVPEFWARGLEMLVGLMLLALGVDVLWRLRRQRVHVHSHQHADGTRHLHAHRHTEPLPHDSAAHDHLHAKPFPARALLVGAVHGMAGSAALLLLTLHQARSLASGLVFIAVFGLGSISGMAALSAVIVIPLRWSAPLVSRTHGGLEALVGLATLGVGLWVLSGLGS